MAPTLPQTVVSFPANTTGGALNTIFTVSVTILHPPLFVDASTSKTEPAIESALLKLYVAFNAVFEGLNVPLPNVVHCPVEDPPLTVPFRLAESELPHILISVPAFTTGAGVKI